MGKPDVESLDLLSDTMKGLFPPRVEIDRAQHARLKRLGEKTGKSVKELVGYAVDAFLQIEDPVNAPGSGDP